MSRFAPSRVGWVAVAGIIALQLGVTMPRIDPASAAGFAVGTAIGAVVLVSVLTALYRTAAGGVARLHSEVVDRVA